LFSGGQRSASCCATSSCAGGPGGDTSIVSTVAAGLGRCCSFCACHVRRDQHRALLLPAVQIRRVRALVCGETALPVTDESSSSTLGRSQAHLTAGLEASAVACTSNCPCRTYQRSAVRRFGVIARDSTTAAAAAAAVRTTTGGGAPTLPAARLRCTCLRTAPSTSTAGWTSPSCCQR
jgi:hypothetical protein